MFRKIEGKVTVHSLQAMKKRGEMIAALTAYDYPTARTLDEAGVDVLLVGDSLGMAVLGYDSTIPVTMEEMLHHTRAVSRAQTRALVVADMPYLSYHVSDAEAVRNAGRFIKDGGAEAVKLEGGSKRASVIRAVLDAEIPVMGHLGLTPQSLHRMGGYRIQGKTTSAALRLIEEAEILSELGVFALVLEGVPLEVAEKVTEKVPVPTIGIGAGPGCDGQILVVNDMLGHSPSFSPKFLRTYEDLYSKTREAVSRYVTDVREGNFPSEEESHRLRDDVAGELNSAVDLGSGVIREDH